MVREMYSGLVWRWRRKAGAKKIRQRRNIIWHPLHVKSKKKWHKWTYLQNRNKLTDLENALMVTGGRMEEKGKLRSWNRHEYTAIFEMYNLEDPTVWHVKLCSMLYSSLNGKAVWERIDTCIFMAKSFHCSPKTTTTLLMSCTTIQI